MASSAPSTPARRRVSSVDADHADPTPSVRPASGGGNRSRLNSSEIPRTYSGLYGSGAPPKPGSYGDDDDDDDGGGADSGVGGNYQNNNNNYVASPPRVRSVMASSSPARHHHGGHHGSHHGSSLLPFELSRNRNTDWIAAGGPALLVTYVSVILVVLLTFLAFVPEPKAAWTLANACHAAVSMVYLHWIKGNPADYMDGTQGEMNAMTCWEQIVSKPAVHHLHSAVGATTTATSTLTTAQNNVTSAAATSRPADRSSPTRRGGGGLRESASRAIRRLRSRDVLVVVPTLLAHASCHVARYQFGYAAINVGVWAAVMLPKMPFMNGVRILGINRTAGIDDGDYLDEEEEESDAGLDPSDGGGKRLNETKGEPKKDR